MIALRNYIEIVHPLFPVLDVEVLKRSILESYTPAQLPSFTRTPYEKRLYRARNMLVLAFGAQVVAGEGDVECPCDVACVWSEVFKEHALAIMEDENALPGGADSIKLWVVYAAFSRSYGNRGGECQVSMLRYKPRRRDETLKPTHCTCFNIVFAAPDELTAMSNAARLITRMGLHRSGAHDLVAGHAHDYRILFAVSFYLEKWACLCHGAPTTLVWNTEADDIAAGLPEVSRRQTVTDDAVPHPSSITLVPAPTVCWHAAFHTPGRLMDDVQSLFESMLSRTEQTNLSLAFDLHERLLEFRASLEEDYDAFEQMNSQLTEYLRHRDRQTIFLQITVYGLYLQLRMLVLPAMLEQIT